MNIFFCYNLDKYSGWGTLAINYINKFKDQKSIIFCNKSNPQIKSKQYEILRDPLIYLKNPFLIIIDTFKLIKILKKIKKNFKEKLTAHILVEPYILFLVFISRFFKKKIFYCIGSYSNILANSFKFKFFFKRALSFTTHLIFLSAYSKKIILDKISIKKSCKIIVLNPIIKLTTSIKNSKKNKFNILSVGAIKERKGYHHLIEVMNILINKFKLQITLNIVGEINENLYFKNLIKKVKKYKLEKNIFFYGRINNKQLNKFYECCDIFALLSNKNGYNFEGYGIVYLEALAKGKQVIISKESGGIDIKKFNKKIFTTKPNAYKNISNFIKNIYSNKKILTPIENVLIYKSIYKNNINIFNKFKKTIL
jgi:glycosyltransferase involved in cell wall biosynthesis